MIAELDGLRNRYSALLVWLLWAHVPVMGLAALWNKAMSVSTAVLAAAFLALTYQIARRNAPIAPNSEPKARTARKATASLTSMVRREIFGAKIRFSICW